MAVRYSNYYTINPDGRSYNGTAPQDVRAGEPIWVKASVIVPVGTVATDTAVLAQLVPGARLLGGIVQVSAANTGLTMSLGYNSAPAAILSASTLAASAANTAFTVAQVVAISALPVSGDSLILTFGGTTSTLVSTITIWAEFANVAS